MWEVTFETKKDFVQILLLVYYIIWSILGISLQEHVKYNRTI